MQVDGNSPLVLNRHAPALSPETGKHAAKVTCREIRICTSGIPDAGGRGGATGQEGILKCGGTIGILNWNLREVIELV